MRSTAGTTADHALQAACAPTEPGPATPARNRWGKRTSAAEAAAGAATQVAQCTSTAELNSDHLDLVDMTIQMNVSEAKAKLSELLDAAAAGTDVVIARSGRAVARLVPVTAPAPRRLGFLALDIDDALFGPLDADGLASWE